MRKLILLFVVILVFMTSISYASSVDDFIYEVKNYANDLFPEISSSEWLQDVLKR